MGSSMAMTLLGNGLQCAQVRGRVVRERGPTFYLATAHQNDNILAHQSANTTIAWTDEEAHIYAARNLRGFEDLGREHDAHPNSRQHTRRPSRCKRFEEAKALMCTMLPVARRVLGESHALTQGEDELRVGALLRSPSTISARRDDARRDGTDRAARAWGRSPGSQRRLRGLYERASHAPRPRNATAADER